MKNAIYCKFDPMLRLALCAVLPMLTAGPSHAETTPWTLSEGGRMRLVVLDANAAGVREAALQIEPAPGWLTYWREPGDSGIPPQVAPAPDSPFVLGPLSFPPPKTLDLGDMRELGYDQAVLLPLTITGPPAPAQLTATAFIGLCRNICIPFQAEFTVDLDDAASAEETALIAEAKARLPEAPSADFALGKFALSPDRTTLHLELRAPAGARKSPEILVSGPSGYLFSDSRITRLSDGLLSVDMPIEKLPHNYEFKGKTWELLVIAGSRSMETTLAFD